jgi:uncharacterized RDD family membrane protein YckC
LRVVTDAGDELTFARAVCRALVLVIVPVLSMLWILVSRKNAGLHDLVCRTAVIYDWRARRDRPSSVADAASTPATVTVTAPLPSESRQNSKISP